MVDYNNFAKTFSKSREKMKWEEINYFLSVFNLDGKKILDIWCWNWRFLWEIIEKHSDFSYTWVDLSKVFIDICKEKYPNFSFYEANMLNLPDFQEKFDYIFFIASFHHLKTLEDRLDCLKKVYKKLEKWWKIIMTNWALNSNLNQKRYWKSKIVWSQNRFLSEDFNIKIGEDYRFYHSFSLEELEYLFKKSWFRIVENKLFENDRNFISIIEK